MANAWGELSWNAGLWGEQSNAIATLTGFGLNTSQGQANYTPLEGWGRFDWGSRSWGVSFTNQQIQPGSFPLTLSQGNVSIDFEINDGWGRLTWGENAWGGTGDVILSGNSLSLNFNHGWGNFSWNTSEVQWGGITTINVAIGQQVNVTGLQLNTLLNSTEELITVDVFLTNTNLLLGTSVGEVDVSPDAIVTGQQLNLSTGNVQAYNRQGWGRYYWGEEVWGGDGIWVFVNVDNTNLGLTVDSGIKEYWGEDSWGSSNTEWGGTYITETDISVTAEVSSIAPVGWGVVGWGQQGWNNSEVNIAMTIAEGEVDPGPDANVIGIGMTVSLSVGTVIAGEANVFPIGQQINISQGTAEGIPNTIASVTGIGLNTAVGTVFAGGNSVILPTGNGLTIALNSINNQIWTEINTGTDATWIEIDTAA
jgi:hypothetical protein